MGKQDSTWRVLGASVIGTSHMKTGRGCDDAHLYQEEWDGTLLIAVADGAGSARHSAIGADRAVKTAIEHLSAVLNSRTVPPTTDEWPTILRTVLRDARNALEELAQDWTLTPSRVKSAVESPGTIVVRGHTEGSPFVAPFNTDGVTKTEKSDSKTIEESSGAQNLGEVVEVATDLRADDRTPKSGEESKTSTSVESPSLREFATTLLLACVMKDLVAAVQLGDGAIVIQEAGGGLLCLPQSSQGEYVNETDFLTDRDYLNRPQYSVIPIETVSGIALLTDGMQMLALKYPENEPHPPFFHGLFTFAAKEDSSEESLAEFLQSERVNGRTDDDKTLVLAVRQWPGAGQES
jgi:hypothetical protein